MLMKSTTEKDSTPPKEFNDSLSDFFYHQLQVFANKTLLLDHASGRQWKGAQMGQFANKIALYLTDELQFKPNQSCVFFHPNSDHVQLTAIGVLFAGGSVCTGDYQDPAHERRYMIETVRPKVVFAHASLYKELLDLRDGRQLDFKLIIMNDLDELYRDKLNGHALGLHRHILGQNFELNLLSGSPQVSRLPERWPVQVDPNWAAFILLTSGSTGKPKPVSRSHRNSLHVCYAFKCPQVRQRLWNLDESSVLAGHLPLDHGTGTFSIKITLASGLKLVVMENYRQEVLLEAIDRHSITDVILGSALVHNLLGEPEKVLANYRLDSWRNLISVGAGLPSLALARAFMRKHPHLWITQAYGMTEVGFVSVIERESPLAGEHAKEQERDLSSVLLPNLTCKLVDRETGEPIGEFNREGELFVAGPTVSPGYLGEQFGEQSRAVFQPNGFYRTYDLCSFKGEGLLSVRGRYSEILCLGDGWKVLPGEIESALLESEAVLEVAVIGIPHPQLKGCHAPRAFVVPANGQVTEEEIIAFAAGRLSEPKQLHGGVKLMDALPYISIGKVDRKSLRQL